jgi:hypothetical protein
MKQGNRSMKVLAWILGIAAALWSGVWYLGATATERVSLAWLQQQADAGWAVSFDSVATAGFPLRFDTRFAALDLADPFTDLAWAADGFRLIQPAYQPQALRAIWPGEQVLSTPLQRLAIRSDLMQALLHLRPTDAFSLVRAEADLAGLAITSNWGWSSAIDTAQLVIADQDSDTARYDIRFDAQGFTPAGELLRLLDPGGQLPEAIERLNIETVLQFEQPWDIRALEVARPQITRIELAELRANWGTLALRASGDLDVDAAGIPTGNLAIRAENWQGMVDLGVNAGAIPAAMQSALESGLALIAGLSGRPGDLDVTLRFSEGQAYLGPIPLGPAPVLALY